MNKKGLLISFLIIALLVLSACSNSSEATSSDENATTTTGAEEIDMEIDKVGQLALGPIMLDGTENAITVEQAQTMLPLWQLYQTMMSEDTTASEELDAVLNQIEKTFTAEQLAAMESLDYSNSMQIMAQLGLRNGFGTADEESGERPEITQGGNPFGEMNGGDMGSGGGDRAFSGEMPSGGFVPSGGDMPSGDEIPSGSEDFTGGMGGAFGEDTEGNTSDSVGGGFGNMQTQMYIPAVIEYLEAIISE